MASREGMNVQAKTGAARIVYLGATPSELAAMFNINRRDVSNRISGIPPCGVWDGIDVWAVKDVAGRLTPFDETDVDAISRILMTHHHNLPKLLSKEFWMGQKHRLDFLVKTGSLWDTQAVVEVMGGVFKMLRLSLTMIPDTLDRETNMSVQQREIVHASVITALDEARVRLVEDLRGRRAYSKGKAYMGNAATVEPEMADAA